MNKHGSCVHLRWGRKQEGREGGREGRGGRKCSSMGPLLICLLEHYLVHPPSLPRLLLLLL